MKRGLSALCVLLVLAGVVWTVHQWYRPYRAYSGNLILAIEPGTRAPEVARILAARGVLAYRWPFLLRYWLGRPRHTVKAGEYFFDRPLRPLDVYRKLVRGDVFLHLVVVPEGSDRFDMARLLHQHLDIEPEGFLRLTQQTSMIRDLDPRAPTLEGFLFPDSYRFPRGVSAATVVATMLARFRRVLDSRFSLLLRLPPERLHAVVTLASLVEKETPEPTERPIIAGVFARRLEKRWPLQCDPTVVYALRLSHRLCGRSFAPITQSDLNFDSPYNTYRHVGLPPGPICSPGEASLQAVLNPAAGDVFYFVSNNHGGHLFARTLAEHQRNVARYRRQVAALRRGTPEAKNHAE